VRFRGAQDQVRVTVDRRSVTEHFYRLAEESDACQDLRRDARKKISYLVQKDFGIPNVRIDY
jgi:hypothetical protein